MSSKVCPKTCTQLSTAAVFICVGVVQLLAGIILLNSKYIFLVAAIDIIAATSNILVGSCLGVSASVWEKKQHQITTKSSARQNVLTGLYISVMVINSTTAIVMIMGEGNKLLNVPPEVHNSTSATFLVEILACAYVTSVCSPIVCIVIALVCLSGSRIQIQGNMKSRDSISKPDSYEWVFDRVNKPRKLKDYVTSPMSDDVFLDRKPVAASTSLINKRILKKPIARNSLSSLGDIQNPLEIWADKRKKILEEITTPRSVFFSDDYLQFPDFKNGSYVETLLPRIKQTSIILSPLQQNTQTCAKTASVNKSTKKISKTNELYRNSQLKSVMTDITVPRPTVCSDTIGNTDSHDDGIQSMADKIGIDHPVETPSQLSENVTDSTRPRTQSVEYIRECKDGSLGERIEHKITENSHIYLQSPKMRESVSQNENHQHLNSNIEENPNNRIFNFESHTVENSKFKKINTTENVNYESKRNFLGSFKASEGRNCKWSDGEVEDKSRAFKDFVERNVFSETSASQRASLLAGEMVPVTVRSATIDRSHSIPIPNIESRISDRDSRSDDFKEMLYINTNGRVDLRQKKSKSLHNPNSKDKMKPFATEGLKTSIAKHCEKRKNVAQKITSMGSIVESPAEECLEVRTEQQPSHSPLNRSRANSAAYSANVLKKLWSVNGSEDNLSSLIMDADSLVGLSDEQLMERTNRIRVLRKSVQMRSKNANEN